MYTFYFPFFDGYIFANWNFSFHVFFLRFIFPPQNEVYLTILWFWQLCFYLFYVKAILIIEITECFKLLNTGRKGVMFDVRTIEHVGLRIASVRVQVTWNSVLRDNLLCLKYLLLSVVVSCYFTKFGLWCWTILSYDSFLKVLSFYFSIFNYQDVQCHVLKGTT